MTKRFLFPVACLSTAIAFGVVASAIVTPAGDWKIAGPFGGTATSLALDHQKPEVLLAGGMNSLLYRSADSGESWALLDFPKRNLSEVTSVLVDPANSSHYLAGIISADGGGLFESHDEGKTWMPVKGVQDFGVRSIVASAGKPSRFIAGTLRGVMLSDDSGATWTRISDPKNLEMGGITATAIDPSNHDILYAGTSHLPWKSIDGGKTWQSIHTGMSDDSDVFSIYVNPANPENVFASACSGIYTSPDRGDNWRKVMGLTFSQRRTHVIRKDPQTEGVIYAGTTMGLFKSPNMGGSWKLLSKEQVNAIVFDPAHPGSMYMAMQYEGLSRASEAGESIKMLNNGFVDRSISAVTRSGDKLIALETQLGETSGIFVSDNRGESWTQTNAVRGLNGVHLKTITGMPSEGRILLGASPHQLYKSIDGGLSWKELPIRLVIENTPATAAAAPRKTASKTARAKPPVRRTAPARKPIERLRNITVSEVSGLYAIKSGTKDVLFAATGLGLLKSGDAGERWTAVDLSSATAVTGLFVAPNSDGRLIARADAGLFISKDFGDHWTPFAFPLPASDVNEVALPVDQSAPIFVGTRVGLYSSTDGGTKWYANLGGIPASTVNSVLYGTGKKAYAIEYGRLYETNDAGTSWAAVPSNLPTTRIRQLWLPDASSNRLYGITSDLGILFRN